MRSDVVVTRLGDHVTLQRGTTYKSALLDQPGPYLLGLASIERNGGFRRDRLRTYGGESPEKLLVRPGDIYVSLKDVTQSGDLLGAVARVPRDIGVGRLTQDTVRLEIRSADGASAGYLYWLLRAPQYRAYCRAHSMGTTNLSLSRTDFLAFPVPPLTPSRQALLRALTGLESKCDTNRRLGVALAELITALFRARFVAFVGAEKFVDTEIGPVPAGWRAGALTDLATFVNGKAFTKHANGSGRPIIRIRELHDGVDEGTPHSDIEAGDEFIARFDDILFAWSGSLGAYRWPGKESLINQHIFKVVPNAWPPWFVFAWIHEHMEAFRSIARDKATTMGHIQRRHLEEARLPLPTADLIMEADEAIGPLDRQRAALVRETHTLRLVQDALLPKLISGQIGVSDTADPAEVIERTANAVEAAAS
jgi:type I restriction enzyme S subunit